MAGLTQQEIDSLILCEKQIIEPPKKNMASKNRSLRNDMKLSSVDRVSFFTVFMRISEFFPDDFTIGLIFNSLKGKIIYYSDVMVHMENPFKKTSQTTHIMIIMNI